MWEQRKLQFSEGEESLEERKKERVLGFCFKIRNKKIFISHLFPNLISVFINRKKNLIKRRNRGIKKY